MAAGWHHEWRRHRVHALPSSLIAAVRILSVVVAIPLETACPAMVSGYVRVLVAGLVAVAAGLAAVRVRIRLPLVWLVLLLRVAWLEIILTSVLVAILLARNSPLLAIGVVVLSALRVLILPAARSRADVVPGASGLVVVLVRAGVAPTLATSAVLVLHRVSQVGQLRVYHLASFLQNSDQFFRLPRVVRGEVSVGGARALAAPGSPDAVNVVFGTVRIIEVDHVFNILHV